MTEPPRPTNSMKIGFTVSGEVEIDYDVDGLDVDSSGTKIGTYKTSAFPISKSMENMISLLLRHFSMYEVTGITKLNDLLSKQLHPHRRITEYDCLCNVKLPEKGVQAMDLVLLIDVTIILGYPFEC